MLRHEPSKYEVSQQPSSACSCWSAVAGAQPNLAQGSPPYPSEVAVGAIASGAGTGPLRTRPRMASAGIVNRRVARAIASAAAVWQRSVYTVALVRNYPSDASRWHYTRVTFAETLAPSRYYKPRPSGVGTQSGIFGEPPCDLGTFSSSGR